MFLCVAGACPAYASPRLASRSPLVGRAEADDGDAEVQLLGVGAAGVGGRGDGEGAGADARAEGEEARGVGLEGGAAGGEVLEHLDERAFLAVAVLEGGEGGIVGRKGG